MELPDRGTRSAGVGFSGSRTGGHWMGRRQWEGKKKDIGEGATMGDTRSF